MSPRCLHQAGAALFTRLLQWHARHTAYQRLAQPVAVAISSENDENVLPNVQKISLSKDMYFAGLWKYRACVSACVCVCEPLTTAKGEPLAVFDVFRFVCEQAGGQRTVTARRYYPTVVMQHGVPTSRR